MKYYEVSLLGREEDYNKIVAWLMDHDVDTFREEMSSLVEELNSSEIQWDYVDEKLLEVEKGQLLIEFYPSEEETVLIRDFENFAKENELGEVKIREIKDEDWANDWKKYFQPFDLGEKLAVVPHWCDYETDRKKILIDPGMAFGSGNHETTYFCLEMLEKYVQKNDLVYDIGCGSGILSVAASLLGAQEVQGVDIDPLAIEASKNNRDLNHCDNCSFEKGDLLNNFKKPANLIVSNLFAEIILSFIKDLHEFLVPGGIFISSGILAEKKDEVVKSLEENNFKVLEAHIKNDWAVVVARNPHD